MTRNEELLVIKTALELTRTIADRKAKSTELFASNMGEWWDFVTGGHRPEKPEKRHVELRQYKDFKPEILINPNLTIGVLFMPIALLIAILIVAVLTKNDISYAIVWIFAVLEVISFCIWYFLLYRPAKQIGIEKMLRSREYIEDRRRVDELNAKALQFAETEYQEKLKEYNEVLLPEYEREYEDMTQSRHDKLAAFDAKTEVLMKRLQAIYDSTKIVPIQYRNESALAFIYDVMSSSNISLVDAILMYDNAIQRDLDAQRVEAQMRTNDLLDEQNELLYRRNQIIHDHLRR